MDLGVRFGTQIPMGTDPGHPRVHSCPALILTSPGSLAYTLVYTVLGVVGLVPYTLIMYVGLNPSLKA